ncbi:S4 domain-containing protein [Blattabacterium cuenoti]|uniref:S4 domain-containing protein n=1 Tax=Blattabacterium cuenoti TaxID=1653831 RepID=UPI001EEB9AA4|nr:S4 domain-containing protein [Blattabacterium cuenoti]
MKETKIKIIVDKNEKKIRIDTFLANRIQNISRNQIQKAMNSSQVLINKKTIKKKTTKLNL